MTRADRMQLLEEAVATHGQSTVARKIGYSPAAVSQVRSGKYAGDPGALLDRVEEVFGAVMVKCPIFGNEIHLGQCAEIRRRPFAATNSQRVREYRMCRSCKEDKR